MKEINRPYKKSKTMEGFFKPKNPQKYAGNPKDICYRSSYELKYMLKLDTDEAVLEWSSEEKYILYKSPKDKKIHRYFPDFIVKRRIGNKIVTQMIEIKPATQTVPPKEPKRKTKGYLNECLTYAVNISKWKAAREYCDIKGYEFVILTEKELGIIR